MWDVSGYYWYLPSLFIYHDLKHQSFKDDILQQYRPTLTDFQQAIKLDNGNYCMKYSSGMAVMYFPFFAIAHLVAEPLWYPKDGFSEPYQFAIQFGGLLVSILGLWYLRKLLLLFYGDKVVALTLLLLVIGTNYLNSSAIDCGMSHCWLFTLYVFLLLNTHYFYQSFKIKYAIRIGLLVGLATLTRPTDVISCLVPVLWGLESISLSSIRSRLQLIAKNYLPLIIAGICAAVVISIQLFYWKYVSGHWFVYSYGKQGFSWQHPHMWLYTFNYTSGWLVYSPMMIFAFIGIIPFLWKGKNKIAILTFFLVNFYIVTAWDIWLYGGRAMVQSYPVLLFPLASLIDVVIRSKVLPWLLAPVAGVCIFVNIWITRQYHRGSMYDSGDMTKAYFWRVVGRWHVPDSTYVLRDYDEMYDSKPRDMHLLYQNDFDTGSGVFFTRKAIKGTGSLVINKEHALSPTYEVKFTGKNARWVRAYAIFHCDYKEWDVWNMAQFVIKVTRNDGVVIKSNMLRVHRLIDDGETRGMTIDLKLPDAQYDKVEIQFWNVTSNKELIIDGLRIWSFND